MSGISNENQLFDLAKRLNIHLDKISLISDLKEINPKKSYILLLKDKKSPIGHWVAFHNGEYFDSFGQPPPMKIAQFVKKYNNKQFQSVDAAFCGWWCLLFLYSEQKKRPNLLKQMTDVSF